MTFSEGTLKLKDLSAEAIELLKKIIELGHALQFFGEYCAWAFPRKGTEYVDVVGIQKNPFFYELERTGLIYSDKVVISARIWYPTEEAKRIAQMG